MTISPLDKSTDFVVTIQRLKINTNENNYKKVSIHSFLKFAKVSKKKNRRERKKFY